MYENILKQKIQERNKLDIEINLLQQLNDLDKGISRKSQIKATNANLSEMICGASNGLLFGSSNGLDHGSETVDIIVSHSVSDELESSVFNDVFNGSKNRTFNTKDNGNYGIYFLSKKLDNLDFYSAVDMLKNNICEIEYIKNDRTSRYFPSASFSKSLRSDSFKIDSKKHRENKDNKYLYIIDLDTEFGQFKNLIFNRVQSIKVLSSIA